MAKLFRLAVLLAAVTLVLGHGYVQYPPSRASGWRDSARWNLPTNYNDNEMFCGGRTRQWNKNGGKCGICGDAYDLPPPRRYEYNGADYVGVITATFLPGGLINTKTSITAFHQGYWVYNLCTDHTSNEQGCFDKHPLELADGRGKKFFPPSGGVYDLLYKLPAGLVCEHCVLQWRYVAGNNWNTIEQEEFRACSDIAILPSEGLDDDKSNNVDLDVDNYLWKYLGNR